MATQVKTVKCPDCQRDWTGHFQEGKDVSRGDATCKDCIGDAEARRRKLMDDEDAARRRQQDGH